MARDNRLNMGLGIAALGLGAAILAVILGKKATGTLEAPLPRLPPRPKVKDDNQNALVDPRQADPDVDSLDATPAQNQAARNEVDKDIPPQQGASLDTLLRNP